MSQWQQIGCADRHPQHSGLGSREQPLQMTQRAQELFLAYAHYCGERGVEPLIPIVKQAVTDAVSNIELTTKLGADQVLQMFSDAHKSERPLRVCLRQICMLCRHQDCGIYLVCSLSVTHIYTCISMRKAFRYLVLANGQTSS